MFEATGNICSVHSKLSNTVQQQVLREDVGFSGLRFDCIVLLLIPFSGRSKCTLSVCPSMLRDLSLLVSRPVTGLIRGWAASNARGQSIGRCSLGYYPANLTLKPEDSCGELVYSDELGRSLDLGSLTHNSAYFPSELKNFSPAILGSKLDKRSR